MLSGRQIREACSLLDWDAVALANDAKVTVEIALRAQEVDGIPSITLAQAAKIQAVFEAEGVRFGRNGAVVMAARQAS